WPALFFRSSQYRKHSWQVNRLNGTLFFHPGHLHAYRAEGITGFGSRRGSVRTTAISSFRHTLSFDDGRFDFLRGYEDVYFDERPAPARDEGHIPQGLVGDAELRGSGPSVELPSQLVSFSVVVYTHHTLLSCCRPGHSDTGPSTGTAVCTGTG